MAKTLLPSASAPPDVRVLAVLASLQHLVLIAVAFIAGVVLVAWNVAPFASLLPASWSLMKANSALCGLLCVLSLTLSQPRRSARAAHLARALAALAALVGFGVLWQYLGHISLGLDQLIVTAPSSSQPGRMSPQSALSFFLLGVILFFIESQKGWLSRVIDAIMFFLATLISIFTCGYLFGALHLFGPTMQSRLAPQTLVVLLGLTFVTFNRRAEYGVFSVLLGAGIGGKATRFAAPFALGFPFVLAATRDLVVKFGMLQPEYATAIATSTTSLLAFALILLLGRQVNRLERDVRDLSLRDQLTGLYNRRGFYVLAEQALRLSRRGGGSFSLIFFDLDNLKMTNDALGHETGSQLIEEMAALLNKTFRETDVIARFGGDEFVVAGNAGADEVSLVLGRLQDATAAANAQPGRPFTLSFSLGHITSDANPNLSLDRMLEVADGIMYEDKRSKNPERAPRDVFRAAAIRSEPAR